MNKNVFIIAAVCGLVYTTGIYSYLRMVPGNFIKISTSIFPDNQRWRWQENAHFKLEDYKEYPNCGKIRQAWTFEAVKPGQAEIVLCHYNKTNVHQVTILPPIPRPNRKIIHDIYFASDR